MADRTSHWYEGAASALLATYTSVESSNQSDGYNCESYDRLLVYVSIGTVVGTGICKLICEYSPDGETYYQLSSFTAGGAATIYAVTFGSTGDYCVAFPSAGKFFRLRFEYVSGTSIQVDGVSIEAKS